MDRKEETKIVKAALAAAGINARIDHGKGTVWGWLHVNIGAGQQFGEHTHDRDEWLTGHGLNKEDIAQRYCDCFTTVPLLRDHWRETGRPSTGGTWIGRNRRYSNETIRAWIQWLKENAEKYEEEYAADFYWDRIKE
jgi:hypothetical protein